MPVNEFKLPDVGEGLTEAEVVSWKVKVGDTVKVNDVVVEIETAKSVVELPSPYSGTVEALLVEEGDTVAVGTPIITVSSGTAEGAAEQKSPPSGSAGADEKMPTLVGYGPRAAGTARRPRRGDAKPSSQAGAAVQGQLQGAFTPGAEPEDVEAPDEAEATEPAVPAATGSEGVAAAEGVAVPEGATASADTADTADTAVAAERAGVGKVLAKPPVRKLARDLGVDLASVAASGPGGTITRTDVESARAEAGETSKSGGRLAGPSGNGTTSAHPGERERREPIKGVRKVMASAMVESAFSAPHVTEWVTLDVTRTMRLVERLKSSAEFREVRVSPLLVVAKAVCLASRRTPEVNATWDEQSQEIVFKGYVNLGIAAATPRGLVVPNIKDADTMSLRDLGAAINDLTATARDGRTQPEQMSGGTFTITNVGVFGVDGGTPIINPGESAILCFGAVRRQPWVRTKKGRERIVPRSVTTLALSFDHRIVDGEKGSRFLSDVATLLEDPAGALLY